MRRGPRGAPSEARRATPRSRSPPAPQACFEELVDRAAQDGVGVGADRERDRLRNVSTAWSLSAGAMSYRALAEAHAVGDRARTPAAGDRHHRTAQCEAPLPVDLAPRGHRERGGLLMLSRRGRSSAWWSARAVFRTRRVTPGKQRYVVRRPSAAHVSSTEDDRNVSAAAVTISLQKVTGPVGDGFLPRKARSRGSGPL